MALGRRFRYTTLKPEEQERWRSLLRGELMDRLHVEPRYSGPSALLWLLAGGSFVALAVMLLRRLGDVWTPPPSGLWAFVVVALSIALALALVLILRAHKLSTMFGLPPGRYLLPVGYIDASNDVWTFVSIREIETAHLEDTRDPISRLPASICRLLLKDEQDIAFVIPFMDDAEELTDVVLLLIQSEEEVIEGLDALIEEFDNRAEKAAVSSEQAVVASASDEPSRQLSWWLRYPIPLAIVLGLVMGIGAESLRGALHVNQQIRNVRKRGDIALARMLLCWAPHQAQRQALSSFIRKAYMAQIQAFERKASAAHKGLGKKLLLPYVGGAAPILPIRLKILPAVGFSKKRKREIDGLLAGASGKRIGWSLASHLRQGLQDVFPRALLWPRYGNKESGFFYYFMVGADEQSRRYYRKQQRISDMLGSHRPCAVDQKASRPTQLEVTYQPTATGRHYELHSISKSKGSKGKHVIEKQRFPAISYRVKLQLRFLDGTSQALHFQLPPAVMLGFFQGNGAKQSDAQRARKVLLSGLRRDGKARIYALMALAAWRKLKAQLPKALYGQPYKQYQRPKTPSPRPAAPTSQPVPRQQGHVVRAPVTSRPARATSQPASKGPGPIAPSPTPTRSKQTPTKQR